MPTSYWSVFKNFEKTSYIDKSDQQKSELLIVPFLSFCNFNFYASRGSSAFFGLKNVTQPF